MKEFDLKAAKAGKAVCTRDGRKARIICWDRKGSDHPIIALVESGDKDLIGTYLKNGKLSLNSDYDDDLMMVTERKEGWVNLYREIDGNIECSMIRGSKEESESHISPERIYLDTVKIEWEE